MSPLFNPVVVSPGDLHYLGNLTVDPAGASLVEGDFWYNTTEHLFKGYNGTNIVLL